MNDCLNCLNFCISGLHPVHISPDNSSFTVYMNFWIIVRLKKWESQREKKTISSFSFLFPLFLFFPQFPHTVITIFTESTRIILKIVIGLLSREVNIIQRSICRKLCYTFYAFKILSILESKCSTHVVSCTIKYTVLH